MNRFALLICFVYFFLFQIISSLGQPIVNTPVTYLNNRYVEFDLHSGVNASSAFFYLFDDGHYSIQNEPIHQYHNTIPYTTEVFAAEPYSISLPSQQTIGVTPISTNSSMGSSTANPFMGNQKIKIGESWSATEDNELIYILSFTYPCDTTAQNDTISGNIEFHVDQNLSVTNFYNPRLDWTNPGSFIPLGSSEPGCQDKLSWSFSNLLPGEVRHVYIHVSIPQGLNQAGLNNIAKILVDGGEGHCSLTEKKFTLLKRYPHDPNGMIVDYQHIPHSIPVQKKLTYTIFFQNSGNYYADDVFIDAVFDGPALTENFQILSSSSSISGFSIVGNMISIAMTGHKLPGSNQTYPNTYSYDQTTGFVKFSICTEAGLNLNDNIEGQASIIFDTQPNIITNTALTIVSEHSPRYTPCSSQSPSSVQPPIIEQAQEALLEVYPNPSSEHINIKYEVAGNQDSPVSISIYNLSGQRLATPLHQSIKAPGNHNLTVDISNFPSGPLVIEVQTSNNTSRYQIIKS